MSSADVIRAGLDLTPAHTAASEYDIKKAYEYVHSVIDTADDDEDLLWHGWALREAILAGMQSVIEEECGCESPGVEKESDAMFDACKYGKAAFSQMAAKMNNELKPCPFCGNVPDVVTSWIPRKVYSTMCVYPNCATRPGTDYFSEKRLAVNAWNNRNKGEIKA